MKNVCVITGGGSGMGLAAAKYMPKDKCIVLSGRTAKKLEKAVAELEALGYEAHAHTCDTSDRLSVRSLADYAASLGEVKNVINAAGLSPAMAKPEQLLRVNALGTVYVNQEFSQRMKPGSVIVDVSSNSAYVLPRFLISQKTYALAETDEALFLKKLLKKSSLPRGGIRTIRICLRHVQKLRGVVRGQVCLRLRQTGHPGGVAEPGPYRHRHG